MKKYLIKKYGFADSEGVPAVEYLREELLVSEDEARDILKRRCGKVYQMMAFDQVVEIISSEL